ncbi:protein-disulfide reductase DsbD [Glaciimonas immobilis]|uniref:Thiol:disulfide interchange protein DsbD n=1 Tax=Glaciimonas immobilis TaxID=728004 RepID=A0A840RX23_9BURK|nr:protein-disulfide reductase DsbD [Glaciimonas immobilis]KAF3998746.1 protein-disulfide reductase DsbD [Glaciimonas immobilis]MBB5201638.1 thiol:disulfide interchange protein DsbD [Glaciimonas immobilis]
MFNCFKSRVVFVVLLTLMTLSMALSTSSAHADEDYLAPEVAFKFSARMADPKTAEVTYAIADGYYMYRERFSFKADGATLGEPKIPAGVIKFDQTFQKNVETYHHSVTIHIPVEAAKVFTLIVAGQGCADKGLCYPPMEHRISLSPDGAIGGGGLMSAIAAAKGAGPAIDSPNRPNATGTQQSSAAVTPDTAVADVSASGSDPATDSDVGHIESSLKGGKLLVIMPLFLLLGLGLSFTPCVLPMVPILSSIIVGEGALVKRRRAFILSIAYVMGMALVYTALGVAAGLAGEGLSAALQNAWVLSAFALLMVLMSLSMFGVYQLQLPGSMQTRLSQASDKQSAGKLAGVFVMGALSALIVGPCVAAPLAGALVYISQSRNVVIGGSALFAMAIGMSVPLLLVGISAGALLPRAGAWMESVKRFFGVLMLGVAVWMIAPVIPAAVQILCWVALGVGYGAYLLWHASTSWVSKAAGLVFATLGLLQLVSVATGGRDVLMPLGHLGVAQSRQSTHAEFVRVKSVAELDAALAQTNGKAALLDFYADWCVSCKEMEKFTFTDPRVKAQFDNIVLLQIDVTANNADDKAMLKRFNLFGPPGIILFDHQGKKLAGGRVIGFQNADKFTRSLAVLDKRS